MSDLVENPEDRFSQNEAICTVARYTKLQTTIKVVFGISINKNNVLDAGRPFLGVDIFPTQLVRFVRVCSQVEDFNARNKCLAVNSQSGLSVIFPILSPTP